MAPSRTPGRRPYPQSVGNLALDDARLARLFMSNANAGQGSLRRVHDGVQEEQEDDPFGPATGIVNGLRLSITLWSFMVLVILLMR
ncbi:MAG: hypothetical protein H8K04_15195 [Nitrospira sp.]